MYIYNKLNDYKGSAKVGFGHNSKTTVKASTAKSTKRKLKRLRKVNKLFLENLGYELFKTKNGK